ncbi:MAG: DUF1353 domain-containing protein [Vampirovibrionales bacterium]|nr:DUF1353 domain-containing protein [Vampirovibrionales bacterium]MBK8200625.1 DUF1353 domain-containing protein [Acidobacteriota bacterium]
MRLRNVRIEGDFDSIPIPGDDEHRLTARAVWIAWEWRTDGDDAWRSERLMIPDHTRWDGASRPGIVGWLVPRWGVFSAASLGHDYAFRHRPFLSNGQRISRKHTDLLFLALMRRLASERVTGGWKAAAQLWLAEVMYRAVRWFGESTWDKHDAEFAS